MDSREDLDRRIEAELEAAKARLAEIQEEAGRRFAESRQRHEHFLEVARRVLEAGDRPLARLADHFDNAEVVRSEDPDGFTVTCRFRHTPRFPASVEVRFDLTHDEEVRKLVAHYRLSILPVFIDFRSSDRLVRELDGIDEDEVAAWIDDRIVEFVRTYLRIPFAEEYQRENLVTDPVADVRFSREHAAGSVEHDGHTYWFVSDETRRAFAEDPSRWVMQAPEADGSPPPSDEDPGPS